MGGPGSGPKKGQRRNKNKTVSEAAGYEEEYVPLQFSRADIDEIGVFDDPDRKQTFPRSGDRKYTKETVTLVLDAMVNGAHVRAIADALGIHERTYFRWMERADFKTLITMAEGQMAVRAEHKLGQIGLDLGNPVALVMWLNAHGKRYGYGKDQKIDVDIHLEGAVDVRHILSDPRTIELENELEARRQQIEDGIIEGDFRELPPHEEDPS